MFLGSVDPNRQYETRAVIARGDGFLCSAVCYGTWGPRGRALVSESGEGACPELATRVPKGLPVGSLPKTAVGSHNLGTPPT